MPRYKSTVEYDGTGFAGWQRQKDAPSIQQCLEEAIQSFSGEQVQIFASGRTDAGVHAYGQVVHFDLQKDITTEKISGAINAHIRPNKISILNTELVAEDFHARFNAKQRHYIYKIINRRAPLALDINRAWFVPTSLNLDHMCQAAECLIGNHDFTSFRDSQCQSNSPIKTLDAITIKQDDEVIEIYVSAKSFLHHMVRNIVGTLKFVGEGKWSPQDVQNILSACDRTQAGPTAPAYGLYFKRVIY